MAGVAQMANDDTVKRQQACAMLGAGATVPDVARVTGVPVRTLYRWQKGIVVPRPPEVDAAAQAVTEARVAALSTMAEGQRAMAVGISEAVEELFTQLRDQSLDAKDRRAAACEILDRAGLVKQSQVEVSHVGAVSVDVSDFRARIERAYEAAKRAQSVEVAQGPQGAK